MNEAYFKQKLFSNPPLFARPRLLSLSKQKKYMEMIRKVKPVEV